MTNNHTFILNGHASTAQQLLITPTTKVIEPHSSDNTSTSPHSLRPVDWTVLRAIGIGGEVKRLEIQKETGLPTSIVSKSTRVLYEQTRICRRIAPGTENQSKPTLLFSLSPGLTLESIEAEMKDLNVSISAPTLKDIPEEQKRSAKPKPMSSQISEIIKERGGTVSEIVEKTGLAVGIVQGYLGRAYRKGDVTRVRNPDKSTLEYIYSLATNAGDSGQSKGRSDAVSHSASETNEPLEQPSMNHHMDTESPQKASDSTSNAEATIWEVVQAMAERIVDLEGRFEQLETALKGNSNLKADQILSLLRKKT
jgi:DNA-binding MarR family transcriptional regulator